MTMYPAQWNKLQQAAEQNRLPHALLFIGQDGIGKKKFAEQFAKALLCKTANACDACQACHLMQTHTHPDCMWIEPEESSQVIKIDQIRGLIESVNTTKLLSQYRVIIIDPAAAMNTTAANALLKTLEEPTPNTVLILLSDLSVRLPKTILSRCQKIIFHAPVQWAASPQRDHFYQGLIALTQQTADPLKCAAEWQEHELNTLFQWLWLWLQDCLRRQVIGKEATWINAEYATFFANFTPARDALLEYLDLLAARKAAFLQVSNLNRTLLLEECFIRWAAL